MAEPHPTRPVQVWVDVDTDIADIVEALNRRPGVRTFSSCADRDSYGPWVTVGWRDKTAYDWLCQFRLEADGVAAKYADGFAVLRITDFTRRYHPPGVIDSSPLTVSVGGGAPMPVAEHETIELTSEDASRLWNRR